MLTIARGRNPITAVYPKESELPYDLRKSAGCSEVNRARSLAGFFLTGFSLSGFSLSGLMTRAAVLTGLAVCQLALYPSTGWSQESDGWADADAHARPSEGLRDTAGVQVAEVRFEGNRVISSEALKVQLPRQAGYFTKDELQGLVRRIYETGYFDQVRLVVSGYGTGRVLRVVVTEKPMVRKVFIEGNEAVSETDLAEVVSFGERRFLDKTKIKAAKDAAKTLYESRGYLDSEFTHSVVPVSDSLVDVTFKVTEGPKYKIDSIQFNGLDKIDPGDLRDTIQTKRYKWWNSWLFGTGRVNRDVLENDQRLIRQYFLDHGFVDATVSEAAIKKADDGELIVSFDVKEGPEYTVGSVRLDGDLGGKSQRDLLDKVKLEGGDVFSAAKVRESAFGVSDVYGDDGFAFANVTPLTNVNRNERKVDLVFQVDRGPLVDIGRIDIVGNDKTYDNVIRRELTFSEEERYSRAKVNRSRQLLERLGYFEEVNITTQPRPEKDKVDALVSVREGSTGTFSIGAGYSSSDGALFNTRLAERNILGTGRSLQLNVDVGTERDNIILSLDDPRVNDSYWSAGADAMLSERKFNDFDRQLAGGGITVGYPLEQIFGEIAQDIHFSTKYQYLDITIDDVDIGDAAPLVVLSEGSSTSSAFTPRLVRNTINNPLNPVSGSRQSAGIELAGAGGSEEYYLVQLSNSWFYPLVKSETRGALVFSWRADFDYGDTFNDDPFPLFRRFFPGGINSVRGYDARSLGPKDELGNEYGGNKQFVNNLELIFPLVESAGLKGVTFYDIGEAFDDDEDFDFGEFREAWGFGLRWNSPLGPFRIELGFPINKEEGEDSPVTMFSFGAPL